MKKLTLVLVIVFSFIFIAVALADSEDTGNQDATETAAAASTGAMTCDEYIQTASEKLEKAKRLLGRSMLYNDPSMKSEAEALNGEVNSLLEAAKLLGPACEAKVEEFNQNRKGDTGAGNVNKKEKRAPEYF